MCLSGREVSDDEIEEYYNEEYIIGGCEMGYTDEDILEEYLYVKRRFRDVCAWCAWYNSRIALNENVEELENIAKILTKQKCAMINYLNCLEIRMNILDIDYKESMPLI